MATQTKRLASRKKAAASDKVTKAPAKKPMSARHAAQAKAKGAREWRKNGSKPSTTYYTAAQLRVKKAKEAAAKAAPKAKATTTTKATPKAAAKAKPKAAPKTRAAPKAKAKPKSNGLSTLTAKQRAAAAKLAPGKAGKSTATFNAKEMAAIRRLLK